MLIKQRACVAFLLRSCLAWKLEKEKKPPPESRAGDADLKHKRPVSASRADPFQPQTEEKSFLPIMTIFPFSSAFSSLS